MIKGGLTGTITFRVTGKKLGVHNIADAIKVTATNPLTVTIEHRPESTYSAMVIGRSGLGRLQYGKWYTHKELLDFLKPEDVVGQRVVTPETEHQVEIPPSPIGQQEAEPEKGQIQTPPPEEIVDSQAGSPSTPPKSNGSKEGSMVGFSVDRDICQTLFVLFWQKAKDAKITRQEMTAIICEQCGSFNTRNRRGIGPFYLHWKKCEYIEVVEKGVYRISFKAQKEFGLVETPSHGGLSTVATEPMVSSPIVPEPKAEVRPEKVTYPVEQPVVAPITSVDNHPSKLEENLARIRNFREACETRDLLTRRIEELLEERSKLEKITGDRQLIELDTALKLLE